MIMIIVIIYIFLSYVIFDQQLKITFRKSSTSSLKKIHLPHFPPLEIQKVHKPPPPHPEKIHCPVFTQPPPKNLKCAIPLLFANIEDSPAERGRRTLCYWVG